MGGSRSMRKKIIKRKYNKRVAILISLVISALLISLITIPKFNSKADVSTSSNNKRILKILEIEPSGEDNLFRLYDSTIGSLKVEVTKMDMSKFISMVDEIEGKYDIVYIGNNCSELSGHWTVRSRYRKYCGKNHLEWGDLWDRTDYYNGNDKARCQYLWYGNGGYVPNNEGDWGFVQKFQSAADGNEYLQGSIDGTNYKHFIEYYSENDITNKRANEIIKLINSDQLVYMDSNIFTQDYDNTNLKTIFGQDIYRNKIKVVDNYNGLLGTMVSDYNEKEEKTKRPIVDLTNPSNSTTLKFKFVLKGTNGVNYKAKLYIDTDGDGLFNGNKDQHHDFDEVLNSNGANELTYSLGQKYVGYYEWKFVIYDEDHNDIKTYNTGSVIINAPNGQKKQINVLQVMPDNGCTFDMEHNQKFNGLLNNPDNKYLNNYNVTVKSISITQFNNAINAGTNYSDCNMIVLGFGDSYGKGTQFNDNAIKFLLQWNKDKKSLMMTHDTIGLGLLNKGKVSTNNNREWGIESQNYCGYVLGRNFKDIVGQCRYNQDPFKNYAGVTYNDSYYDDVRISNGSNNDSNNYATMGITAFANIKLYENTRTSKVKLVNDNQISNYPYDLTEKDEINIAETHCMWYQLNLEEDDVVPSYNLVDKDNNHFIDSGDSRNFCYTYTKGNITYTGSGDHEIDNKNTADKDSEMKLFINTMLRAYKAGNEGPTVSIKNQNNIDEVLNDKTITLDLAQYEEGTPYTFMTNIKDDSSEDQYINVDITKNRSSFYSDRIKYDGSLDGINVMNQSISYDELRANIGNTITINVNATDEEGAPGSAAFKINVICSKLDIINGINKDEEQYIANNPGVNYEYQSSWYYQNAGDNGALHGDVLCTGYDNMVSSGTRGYRYVVPFISKIDTNITEELNIKLQLDKNFSENPNEGYGEAYEDEGYGELIADNISKLIFTKPTVYVDYNGNLYKVKELERDLSTGEYNASISVNELVSAYSEAGINVTLGSECNLVVKYYAKAYNHNTSGEDDSILQYKNSIYVSNGNNIPGSDVFVNVGYKKLHGNLF